MVRPRVFLDFTVGETFVGRVILELYKDTAPRSSENFRALCTGEKGISPLSERPLYYKNSIIHRSIKDFMIQGGDFTKRNGSGGESIYGEPFQDDDLTRPLDTEALLCMANKGPNTNNSQFFITLRPCPHLNGKHVVFGKVIRGYEVVEKIAEVPVDAKDRPAKPVVISNCGELELRKKVEDARSHKPENDVAEPESGEESGPRRKRRKHRRRSESEDGERRSSKKNKRRRSNSLDEKVDTNQDDRAPVQETEEEYDARLEREERERIEAARKQKLEAMRRRYEDTSATTGGIRYKGRGRMKYVDPEDERRR